MKDPSSLENSKPFVMRVALGRCAGLSMALAVCLILVAFAASSRAADQVATTSLSAVAAERSPVVAVRPQPCDYVLSYKFVPNTDVKFLLDVDVEINVQKGATVTNTKNKSTMERHFHVAEVGADGSALLELYIDRVKLSYSFDDNPPISFDTQGGVLPPPGFQKVKASVGRQLAQVRVTPQGRLTSIIAGEKPVSDDGEQNFLVVLPGKPVRVGDDWSDDIQFKVNVTRRLEQKILLRRRYTLESVHGNMATIMMRTSEITPVVDPGVRVQLLQATPEGRIFFDRAKGMIASREQRCSRVEANFMGPGSVIASTSNLKGSLK